MTDKEVGELWQEKNRHSTDCVFTDKIDQLIRKIVAERARNNAVVYYRVHGPDDDAIQSCIKSALRDFGIDPATW